MQATAAKNETRLPRAVLRRSAAIEARLAAQRGEPEQVPGADDGTPANPPIPPSADVPADPNAPTDQPIDPRANDPQYWKSRFDVTSGLLRTEREARKADRTAFNQRIAQLQEEIITLQAAKPVNTAEIDLGAFFTPEEVEALGEEHCRAMASTAMKAAKASMQTLVDTQIKPAQVAREAAAADEAQSRMEQFKDELRTLVPDYETIDNDPEWLDEWLEEIDPATHAKRGTLLDYHCKTFNAKGAAAIFQAFKKSKARPTPPVQPHGRGATPPGGVPPKGSEVLLPLQPGEAKRHYTQKALGKVTKEQDDLFEKRRKLSGRG
jgi:hypothetical protein